MPFIQNKISGALLGVAIGDAMGGPVEMLNFTQIEQEYGWVDTFLPYRTPISPHGAWSNAPGSVTDDTRMTWLVLSAVLNNNNAARVLRGDVKMAVCRAYHSAEAELERQFLEEYCYKAIYGEEKLIFGGQPTNGGIMAASPIGLINAFDPFSAFDNCMEALFFTEGYARQSAAMAAAAVAAAVRPSSTPQSVLDDMLAAASAYKLHVEGPEWQGWDAYEHVANKNEKLVRGAVGLAGEKMPRQEFYPQLLELVAQPFFADGAETLAIAMAMLFYNDGDFASTILDCVNFGRDCDSSASVAGAITGAMCGSKRVPAEWSKTIKAVNPFLRVEDKTNLLFNYLCRRFELLEKYVLEWKLGI